MKKLWSLKALMTLSLIFLATCSSGGGDLSQCGNGVVDKNETCDDGNSTETDTCNSQCQVTFQPQSLGEEEGEVKYLHVGKVDAELGQDLLLISSESVEDRIFWHPQFLSSFGEKDTIFNFARSSTEGNKQITKLLSAYQAGDIDQDGFIDLAYAFSTYEMNPNLNNQSVSTKLDYFKNGGDQSFVSNKIFFSGEPHVLNEGEHALIPEQIRLAEINNDNSIGSPDIILTTWFYPQDNSSNGETCVIYNPSFNSFCYPISSSMPQNAQFEIGALDLQNQFYGLTFFGKNIYLYKQGNSALNLINAVPDLTTPANITQLAIQDLNADSTNDLIVLTTNALIWYQNTGITQFSAPKNISTINITHFESGDLDRDGLNDILAFSASNGGEILWIHNDGGDRFTVNSVAKNLGTITAQHLVDADEDGDLDLVFATGKEIKFLENNL